MQSVKGDSTGPHVSMSAAVQSQMQREASAQFVSSENIFQKNIIDGRVKTRTLFSLKNMEVVGREKKEPR